MLFFVLLSFILRDKPDKRLPCLHEQTFVGHRRWMSSGHPLSADRSRAETSERHCRELHERASDRDISNIAEQRAADRDSRMNEKTEVTHEYQTYVI